MENSFFDVTNRLLEWCIFESAPLYHQIQQAQRTFWSTNAAQPFFLILLLLLKSEIKLSFDTLDLVKKCHISLQQQLLLKKLLAITRKIAGAWKSKKPQKLATPTIIKKTGAQLKVVIFKIWSSWIRIRMATLTQLMTWILYVHISKIGTFSIKKF